MCFQLFPSTLITDPDDRASCSMCSLEAPRQLYVSSPPSQMTVLFFHQSGLVIVEAVFGRLEAMPPAGSVAAAGSSGVAAADTASAADMDAAAETSSASAAEPQPSPQPRAHRLDSGAQSNTY